MKKILLLALLALGVLAATAQTYRLPVDFRDLSGVNLENHHELIDSSKWSIVHTTKTARHYTDGKEFISFHFSDYGSLVCIQVPSIEFVGLDKVNKRIVYVDGVRLNVYSTDKFTLVSTNYGRKAHERVDLYNTDWLKKQL